MRRRGGEAPGVLRGGSGLPAENLSVYLAPAGGAGRLASLWWRRASRPWLLLGLAVAGSVAGALLLRAQRGLRHQAGLLVSLLTPVLVLILTPANLFGMNPIGFMKTWFLFVPGLLAACFAAGWLARTTARWAERRGL